MVCGHRTAPAGMRIQAPKQVRLSTGRRARHDDPLLVLISSSRSVANALPWTAIAASIYRIHRREAGTFGSSVRIHTMGCSRSMRLANRDSHERIVAFGESDRPCGLGTAAALARAGCRYPLLDGGVSPLDKTHHGCRRTPLCRSVLQAS